MFLKGCHRNNSKEDVTPRTETLTVWSLTKVAVSPGSGEAPSLLSRGQSPGQPHQPSPDAGTCPCSGHQYPTPAREGGQRGRLQRNWFSRGKQTSGLSRLRPEQGRPGPSSRHKGAPSPLASPLSHTVLPPCTSWAPLAHHSVLPPAWSFEIPPQEEVATLCKELCPSRGAQPWAGGSRGGDPPGGPGCLQFRGCHLRIDVPLAV